MNHRWLTFTLLSLLFSSPHLGWCGDGGEAGADTAPASLRIDGAPPGSIAVHFYDVRGSSIAEIKAAIRAGGPKDHLGISRDAYAHWKLTWEWGEAGVLPATIRCTGEVTLPRWATRDDASPELVSEWARYIAVVAAHEKQHLKHCFDAAADLRRDIDAAVKANPAFSVSEANKLARRRLREARTHDAALDRATDHGRNDGAVLREPQV